MLTRSQLEFADMFNQAVSNFLGDIEPEYFPEPMS